MYELTPELADRYRNERKKRYFVKMDAGPCSNDPNDICRVLDKTLWEPLSDLNPQETWTRLDCVRYRDLCHELSTESRVMSITGHRKVDFSTVAHTTRSNNNPTSRLVEMYRSSDTVPDKLVKYLKEMSVRDLPFEAMNPRDIESIVLANDDNTWTKGRVSLTVLVLTLQGFTKPDAWSSFLELSQGSVRILMHQKSFRNTTIPGVIQVPPIFSHRGTVALVRPVIQLLRFALAYGGSSHYVLVSGDSVPLRSPSDMIRELSKTSNQTRFERHAQDEFKVSPELRTPYKHFEKSKNWFVLTDQAARFFADPQHDYTYNFEILSMADEYYWINVAKEHNISYSNLPVMYDEWPVAQAERPNSLKVVDSTQMRAQGHLFARKVTKDTTLQLDWLSVLESRDDESSSSSSSASIRNEL